jgi:hypothetical protein
MVLDAQTAHAMAFVRRRRIGWQRLSGAAFWYGTSFIVPANWKWFP